MLVCLFARVTSGVPIYFEGLEQLLEIRFFHAGNSTNEVFLLLRSRLIRFFRAGSPANQMF